MRIVIVGAGLVGTSIARSLARRGAEVVVVERGVPGAEASWAAGGILSPLAECDDDGPLLRLCLEGLQTTRAWCAQLKDRGHDVELIDGGTLDVALDETAEARLRARLAWQERAGYAGVSGARWLDAAAVHDVAPGVGEVRGAAFFPAEASLDPRLLFLGLRDDAVTAGARFVTHRVLSVSPRHVEIDDGGVAGRVEGDAVVVAAGAWTPQVRGAGVTEEAVFPVRGQMLELRGAPGAFSPVVFSGKGYVVPRRDGRVLAGSTMERVGFDKAVTVAGLQRLAGMIATLVPGLVEAPVLSSWAGLRPGTIDGLPLLGPQADGVWIASGHFRNGVLLAAATAERLTSALLDGDVAPLAPFSPARFG